MGFRCCQDVDSTGGSIIIITVRILQSSGQVPSVATPAHTHLFPPIATSYSRSHPSMVCFYLVFLQAPWRPSCDIYFPRAGPGPCLGMDPVLEYAQRSLLHHSLSGLAGVLGSPLFLLPWAEQRDPWLEAWGGAGASWVIRRPAAWQPEPLRLQRTGLPTSLLLRGRPSSPHPPQCSRRTELLEFPAICVTQSWGGLPGWDLGLGCG